jgi:hypothetical protein
MAGSIQGGMYKHIHKLNADDFTRRVWLPKSNAQTFEMNAQWLNGPMPFSVYLSHNASRCLSMPVGHEVMPPNEVFDGWGREQVRKARDLTRLLP